MSWLITPSFTQWTPADITTALWLDAADASSVLLSGSKVTQWNDKSGTGNHLSNATDATRPTYLVSSFNSLPTISFTQTGQEFLFNSSMTGFASNNDFFIGAVFEMLEPDGPWDMICGWRSSANTATNGTPVLQGLGTGPIIGVHYTDVIYPPSIKVDVTTRLVKRIATIGRNGGADGDGGTFIVTATGPSQASYETTATQTWASSTTSGFQVGGRQQAATSYANKYISEIICCPNNLSIVNRQKVEGYLAHKWGLTASLPADHPCKVNPPAP